MAVKEIPAESARNVALMADTAANIDLPLAQIVPGKNPRQTFDQEALEQLAESIRRLGVLEPLLVRPIHKGGESPRFELLAGERRWRAAQLAGLRTVPTRVLPGIDDEQAAEIALVENLQRVDLNPMEEAEGYRQLADLGWKQAQIAEAVKRSQPAVANTMRLLKLPEDVQQLVRDRALSASHGVALLRLEPFPDVARATAKLAIDKGLSAHEVEKVFDRQTWPLEQLGVIASVGYSLIETCQKCPFEAFRSSSFGSGICLRPEHHRELVQQQSSNAAKRVEAAVAEATEKDGTAPRLLSDLRYDEYVRLDDNVPGCAASCACRATAIDGAGRAVQICVKPGHRRSLQARETGRQNKWRAGQRDEAIAVAIERVDRHSQPNQKDLVLMLAAIVRGADYNDHMADHVKAAAARQSVTVDLSAYASTANKAEQLEALEQLGVGTLTQLILEAILRRDITRRYDQYQWTAAADAVWWLGRELPRDGGKPEPAGTALVEDLSEDDEASRALTRQVDRVEGRACYLCDCLDDPNGDGEYIGECINEGICCEEEGCREKGVAFVTEKGGVCHGCAENQEICRRCGCTNDDGCEVTDEIMCEWAEPGLCTVCAERGGEVAS